MRKIRNVIFAFAEPNDPINVFKDATKNIEYCKPYIDKEIRYLNGLESERMLDKEQLARLGFLHLLVTDWRKSYNRFRSCPDPKMLNIGMKAGMVYFEQMRRSGEPDQGNRQEFLDVQAEYAGISDKRFSVIHEHQEMVSLEGLEELELSVV
jgi:hypothetical protein